MISFYYGEQNHGKLKKLIRMSLKIISVIAAVTLIASLVVTEPLVSVFARPGNPVYDFGGYRKPYLFLCPYLYRL